MVVSRSGVAEDEVVGVADWSSDAILSDEEEQGLGDTNAEDECMAEAIRVSAIIAFAIVLKELEGIG
jgi:hypothetical protein